MSKAKWSADKTLRFVNEYRTRKCLWNSTLASYKDRQAKDVAYAELAEMFDCGVNDVKIKIKNLRTTYIQENKKIMESVKANSGKEGAYVPSLIWYNEMDSFLRYTSLGRITPAAAPSVGATEIKINEVLVDIKEEALDITSENSNFESEFLTHNLDLRHKEYPQTVTKKRKQADLISLQTLENHNSDIFEEHEFDIFGKSVAKQLKGFSSIAAALRVQSKIQTLLTEERIQDQIAATSVSSRRPDNVGQRFFYSQVSPESNWSTAPTVPEVHILSSGSQDMSNLSSESCTSGTLHEDTKEFEMAFVN